MKDLDIPLTKNGRVQAEEFAALLPSLLNTGGIYVYFYASPGIRNRQTLKIVKNKLPKRIKIRTQIDPLIVKQDWGHITATNRPLIEAERYKIGVLRYKFPTGESAASLIERLTSFRDKVLKQQNDTVADIVIFSHGFEFRVLLMLFLGWDEELFESYGNVSNCEYRILTKNNTGKYILDRPLRKHGQPITRLSKK